VESDYYARENQERNRGDWEVRNAGVGIKWKKYKWQKEIFVILEKQFIKYIINAKIFWLILPYIHFNLCLMTIIHLLCNLCSLHITPNNPPLTII
jgi:hypothetical protein